MLAVSNFVSGSGNFLYITVLTAVLMIIRYCVDCENGHLVEHDHWSARVLVPSMSPRKSVSAQSSVRPFDSGYISPVILLTCSRTQTTLVLISLVFPTPQTSMETLLFSLPERYASVLDSGYSSCVRRSGSLLFRLGAILVSTADTVQMSALWFRSGYALIAAFRIFHACGVPPTCLLDTVSCPLGSGSLRSTGHWKNNFVFHDLCVPGSREKYR